MPLFQTVEIGGIRLEPPALSSASRGAIVILCGIAVWREDLEQLREWIEEALS